MFMGGEVAVQVPFDADVVRSTAEDNLFKLAN